MVDSKKNGNWWSKRTAEPRSDRVAYCAYPSRNRPRIRMCLTFHEHMEFNESIVI